MGFRFRPDDRICCKARIQPLDVGPGTAGILKGRGFVVNGVHSGVEASFRRRRGTTQGVMKCHVLSCDVMVQPPLSSLRPGWRKGTCGGRGDRGEAAPASRTQGPLQPDVMKCHVLSCGASPAGQCGQGFGGGRRPCGRFRRQCRARVVHGHRCLLPGKGRDGCPCFVRVARVRAYGAAGGRNAAARFARLIARARRHTHLACPFPPGSFSRPQPSLSAETPKGGPRGAASLYFHSTPYRLMSSLSRNKK